MSVSKTQGRGQGRDRGLGLSSFFFKECCFGVRVGVRVDWLVYVMLKTQTYQAIWTQKKKKPSPERLLTKCSSTILKFWMIFKRNRLSGVPIFRSVPFDSNGTWKHLRVLGFSLCVGIRFLAFGKEKNILIRLYTQRSGWKVPLTSYGYL